MITHKDCIEAYEALNPSNDLQTIICYVKQLEAELKEAELRGAEKLIKMLHSEEGALGYEYTYLLEEFQASQKEGVK